MQKINVTTEVESIMKSNASWDDKVEDSIHYLARGIDGIRNRLDQLFDFLLVESGDEEEKKEYGGSCEGCAKLDRRYCILGANHCIRRSEDYYEEKTI